MSRRIERYDADGKGYPSGGDKFERYDADGKPMTIGGGGGGDVTNASNIGTGTGEFFKDLVATILRFRTLKAIDDTVLISTSDDEVFMEIDDSTINHALLDNLTVGDPHTQYTLKSLFDANSILKADSDNTPVALPVAASRIVARLASGGIVDATVAQIKTLLAYVFTDIPGILGLAKGGTNADLSGTGPGALVQASTGAAVTVETLAATRGGTGQSTIATGDTFYGSASNAISKLAATTNGFFYKLVLGVPAWAAITAADIASGILALARGGTGADLSGTGPGALVQATSGAVVTVETLAATRGGTAQTTYATGDTLYASASNTLSKLAAGTNGTFKKMVAGIPAWAAIAASDIASGILALVRGGTGADLSGTGPGFVKQATSGAVLSVTATVDATTDAYLSGDISPSTLTGTQQNDYNPTGLSTASTLRLNATTDTNISGIQGGADGRLLILHSIGTASVILLHDITSTAGNRFLLPDAAGMVAGTASLYINPGESVLLQYDSTSSRWRVVGHYTNAIINIYTVDDTWTKPVGAKTIEVYCIGGGGGGGGGRKGNQASARRGGSAGAGGQQAHHTFVAASVNSSVSVDVGAGGGGGNGTTTTGTNGSDGNDGAHTSFGSAPVYLRAGGGKKGLGGTATVQAGGQGGTAWNGTNQTIGDGQYGGGEVGGNGGDGTSIGGGAGEHGGGGGAGAGGGAGFVHDGGGSVYGGGGGGAGGGSQGANNTVNAAGAGGNFQSYAVGGGPAGGTTPSGAGNPGTAPTYPYWGGAGGGGGGAGIAAAADTPGGNGGAGGLYGGGGGGGGVATGTNAAHSSGAGGTGAAGLCIVITHL